MKFLTLVVPIAIATLAVTFYLVPRGYYLDRGHAIESGHRIGDVSGLQTEKDMRSSKTENDEFKSYAISECEDQVKLHIKTPSTAKFPHTGRVSVFPNGAHIFNIWDEFDSQNVFGAMIRSSYSCKMRRIGPDDSSEKHDSWKLVYLAIDGAVISSEEKELPLETQRRTGPDKALAAIPAVSLGAVMLSESALPSDINTPPRAGADNVGMRPSTLEDLKSAVSFASTDGGAITLSDNNHFVEGCNGRVLDILLNTGSKDITFPSAMVTTHDYQLVQITGEADTRLPDGVHRDVYVCKVAKVVPSDDNGCNRWLLVDIRIGKWEVAYSTEFFKPTGELQKYLKQSEANSSPNPLKGCRNDPDPHPLQRSKPQ